MPYNKEKQKEYDKRWIEKNREKKNELNKKWRDSNKEWCKSYELKRKFNITPEDYNRMFEEQAGRCKICNTHASNFTKALAVDHCHTTGKVRGLLCDKCNRGIGLLGDDVEILKAAVRYLEE